MKNTKQTTKNQKPKNILIISNRLPVQINIKDDEVELIPSVGGLATGMKSVYKEYDGKWIGWPGITEEELSSDMLTKVEDKLNEDNYIPVNLQKEEFNQFYEGFSNKTIWPLFHYFTQFTQYDPEHWQAYINVNKKFAEVVLDNLEGVTDIWIHDYHFMLLPQMIKEVNPNISIGYFLHIPFPSYEVFRILPWRKEIIEGLLGADLLGFHTFDYVRHFVSCVRRLLGKDVVLNQINLEDRIVKVETFPMGIDYNRFHNAAVKLRRRSISDVSDIRKQIEKYLLEAEGRKLVLSIDRLDYSKGIPNRLRAFKLFLEKYPQYHGKISLVMLSVPSRIGVEHYQQMKSEVDELVGSINGDYATINWTPVWYFYRSMPFEDLVELYSTCDIALLTPVRDGMNLVAKEYIASRVDGRGTLILSEMAGAAKEMGESIIINPHNMDEIADAIKNAIEMPIEEQTVKIDNLQKRLKRYNVEKWAEDFISALNQTGQAMKARLSKRVNSNIFDELKGKFSTSKKKILFLDYDGTLVGFKKNPQDAYPDERLYTILDILAEKENTEICIISGRDQQTLNKWFGHKNYHLIAEHGVWIRKKDKDWEVIETLNNDWKDNIRHLIEFYVDRTPGSFIEEKNYSLVWHYRKSDPEMGMQRAIELKDELTSLVSNFNLEIMEGNRVIEIKNSGINKGRAANLLLHGKKYDFILGMGDDWTDEFLFESLPEEAVTIKVGLVKTSAKLTIESHWKVRDLLEDLGKS